MTCGGAGGHDRAMTKHDNMLGPSANSSARETRASPAVRAGPRPRNRPSGHEHERARRRSPRKPNEPGADELRPPSRELDLGLMLLAVFTASTLLMVALVVFVGASGRAWTLIPVMAVHLAVTATVLMTVIRLLADPDA
jgi:hypothetical protein